jgi:hypothetical protein
MRCFALEKQHQWVCWLPLAEWWYNTTYHTMTKMMPYEVVYVQQLPLVVSYLPGTSKVQEMKTLLHNCQLTLATLKDNLAMTQNRMKQQAYQHCS